MGRYQVPGCEDGRPTRASLTKGFEFPVPAAFVTLVQAIWDEATARGESPYDLYEQVIGGRPVGVSGRHPDLTPWEMCPIADTGCDGEHYGYVLHAPELGPFDDLPMGTFVPGPGDGVCRIGMTTHASIVNLLSYHYVVDNDPPSEAVLAVAAKLGITFVRGDGEHSPWFVDGAYARIVPDVPPGYRFVPMRDGVGVLAPAHTFSADPREPEPTDAATYEALADAASARGHDGDALIILRAGIDRDVTQAILDRAMEVYARLGRPPFL